MRHPFPKRAFTLIELMLAVAFALAVMVLAVPAMRGLSGEKRLQEKFDKFDELTRKAQLRAVSQQQPWTLAWDRRTISLQPDESTPEELLNGGRDLRESFAFDDNETYSMKRTTSLLLEKDTPAEWTFWRSGTCEPVIVAYTGPDGTWTAEYNPLTGRGKITDMVQR